MLTKRQRDYQRYARRGTTTQRGYHSRHQRERERRLLAYRPGDICAHGGEPLMFWPLAIARRYLDLPHTADRAGYLPGLSCRKHNRADGQAKTTAILNAARQAWRTSRAW